VLRDAVKRLRFAQLPRCLVVHLKRFRQDARGRTSKIGGHVAFEEALDLAPYWSPPPPPAGEGEGAAVAEAPPVTAPASLYRLQGVVEHSGGLHGGHYVAFVRRGADWHYASDRHVRPATLAQALSAEAYLLFYAREDVAAAAAADAPAGEDAAQGQDG
jgi:ubiquitin C-terminal hydrolase